MLLQQTRQQSRESTALSEVLGGPLAQRLSYFAEDVGRLVKKARLLPWAWEAGKPQDLSQRRLLWGWTGDAKTRGHTEGP